jgi:hypothetical protein
LLAETGPRALDTWWPSLYEVRGGWQKAIDYYNKFVTSGRMPTPTFSHVVEEVKQLLARLVGESQ